MAEPRGTEKTPKHEKSRALRDSHFSDLHLLPVRKNSGIQAARTESQSKP
jgi:hypothetical protein